MEKKVIKYEVNKLQAHLITSEDAHDIKLQIRKTMCEAS